MEDPEPSRARASFSWCGHLPKLSHALEIQFWVFVFVFDFLNSKVKIKALSIDSYFIGRNFMCLVIVNYFKGKMEEPL